MSHTASKTRTVAAAATTGTALRASFGACTGGNKSAPPTTTPSAAAASYSSRYYHNARTHHHHHHDGVDTADVDAEDESKKHIMAERYKTKMCKNFVSTGACPYEVRCMFAHGDGELRTAEMNMADGLTSEEAIKAYQQKQRRASIADHHNTNAAACKTPMYNLSVSRGGAPRRAAAADTTSSTADTPKRNNSNVAAGVAVMNSSSNGESAITAAAADQEYFHNDDEEEEEMEMMDVEACNEVNTNTINSPSVVYAPYARSYRYRHNPYALDILPPQSRLYSSGPALLPLLAMHASNNDGSDDYHHYESYDSVNVSNSTTAADYFPSEEMYYGGSVTDMAYAGAGAGNSSSGGYQQLKAFAEDGEAALGSNGREMILEP